MTGQHGRSIARADGQRRRRRIAAVAGVAALAVAAGLVYLDHARAADGWHMRVVASGLERPDNLALTGGRLYLTEELPDGKGRVLRLENRHTHTVLAGLNKPDGLLAAGDVLYVTEEVPGGRVLRLAAGDEVPAELARLHNPEGIGLLPDGSLVVAEDIRSGRLVRVLATGGTETLLAHLDRPEGVAVDSAGCVLYAETGRGSVSRWCGGAPQQLVAGLRRPDQVALCPDGSLWIGEDLRHGARLLWHRDGVVRVVAAGLRGVQGIQCPATGRVLVAEQARGRVLEFSLRPGPRRD